MLTLTKNLLHTSKRSLLIAAVALHLFLAISTFILAKVQAVPGLRPDGVLFSVTPDSIDHLSYSEQLANFIKAGDFKNWYHSPLPINTKIYSVSFLVMRFFVGTTVLAGEPVNLLLYIAILILVFTIGKTIFNREVGLLSAIVVGLWPSFLLHTTQLLKDQFFIAAFLLLVLIMINWLTKAKTSVISIVSTGIAGAVSAYVMARTRTPYWILLIVVLVSIGFGLLVIRQLIDRRLRLGQMCSAVVIIFVLVATYWTTPETSLKVAANPHNPPTVAQTGSSTPADATPATLKRRLDLLAVRIWQFRFDYERREGGAGTVDNGVVFADAKELLAYVPRATLIGLFAPFPNQWFVDGRQSGKIGRRFAAAEMLLAYVMIILAVVALWRMKKHLATWLLVLISLAGVTTLATIVTNLGALFRMRYGFFILLVPLAASEVVRLIDSRDASRSTN